MYALGKTSEARLEGLHPDLVRVVRRAMSMQVLDFSIVEGLRTFERQKELFKKGASTTMDSKHLRQADGSGHAFDAYPYPVDMVKVNKGDTKEISRFGLLAGVILAAAKLEGVKIVWGADWDGDGQTLDHTFFDAPHFQLA